MWHIVAYMFGVGKRTVLKVLQKGLKLQHLGDPCADLEDILLESSRFITACYGWKRSDFSKIRYELWLVKTSKQKLASTPNLKSLPPTQAAFNEKVERAYLQASIWNAALNRDPPNMNATAFGWSRDKCSETLIRTVQLPPAIEAAPAEVLLMLKCGCSTDEPRQTAQCGCATFQMTCTVFCKWFLSNNCQNSWIRRTVWTEDADQDEETDTHAVWNGAINIFPRHGKIRALLPSRMCCLLTIILTRYLYVVYKMVLLLGLRRDQVAKFQKTLKWLVPLTLSLATIIGIKHWVSKFTQIKEFLS